MTTVNDMLTEASVVETGGSMEPMQSISLEPIPRDQTIPTGIDLLNLYLSGDIYGGFRKGSVVELVAESGVGKSLFAINMLKTCSQTPLLSNYKYRYIDKEDGCYFDLPDYMSSQLEFFNSTNAGESLSTIERTYTSILNWLDEGVPQIIVLDSLNAFVSEAIRDSIEEHQAIVAKNKTSDLSEARMASVASATSKYLPMISEKLTKTGSILLIISQYRENIGAGLYESKVRTSGGKAKTYYNSYMITLSKGKDIKKTVEATGRELVQAYEVNVRIDKNRGNGITGKTNVFSVPFRGLGIQIGNITAMVNYLLETNVIKRKGAYCSTPWFREGKNFHEKDLRVAAQNDPTVLEEIRKQCHEIWLCEQKALSEGIY